MTIGNGLNSSYVELHNNVELITKLKAKNREGYRNSDSKQELEQGGF